MRGLEEAGGPANAAVEWKWEKKKERKKDSKKEKDRKKERKMENEIQQKAAGIFGSEREKQRWQIDFKA